MLKILHTADWHIGRYVGPQTDDFAIKMAKTKEILDELVATAKEEQPDLILICGDLFHQERVWADRGMKEVRFVADYIIKLMDLSRVIVIKGTPSHDGDEQYKVLQDMLGDDVIYTNAQIVSEDIYQVLTLPAMDKATVRQNLENQEIKLTPEQENIELSRILSDTLHGFVAQRNHEKPLILAGHYSVTGAKNDNGQDIMFNTDVCLIKEELEQLDIDLICLGHIHGQQQVCSNGWYSGSIDRLNFSDEGKNKGVLVHTMDYIGQTETVTFTLPARQYLTIEVNEKDLKYITLGRQYVLDNVQNKVVRFLYSAPKELDRQLDKKAIEKALYDSGAYYVTEIRNTTDTEGMNRETIVSATEEESLLRWLDEKYGEDLPLEDRILSAGTEIIQTARASRPDGGQTGIFIPQNITVRNYRSYASESVDFDSFDFAMVNGPNGAGKSSLFMDAIAECLYKETREGDLAGWVRKGQRSGTIEFTFLLGQSTYKVIRSRQQSGGGSLDIMRLKDDLWHNISENTMDLTQKKIEDLLGMDAYTFKTCALIMQDQYGKFMEAKPEDRMDALGYVLGLGIYSDMEKIARNNYTEENRILRDLKEKLSELKQDAEGEEEVSARIESLGKVQEVTALSIEKTSGILEGLMIKQSTLTSKEQELFKSAKKMEEIQKATDDLYDKEEKLETKKESYQAIVDKESDLLIQIDALNKGRENLNKRLKEKAEKQMELKGLEEKRNFLGQLKAKLKSKLAARDLLLDDVKEKEKHQAIMDQLSGVKEELDQYMAREERKIELKRSLEQQDVELRSFQRESTAKEDFYNKQIQALEKKIEIRNNAECIDITKAKCRFLADTIGAEEEIERIKKELENLCAAVVEKKSEHNAKGKRTREEIISLNLSIDEKFRRESDYERYLEAKEKVADLRHTDAALDSITADIKEIQDQIDQAEKASDEQAETTLKNVLATLKSRITESQAAQIEYERLTPQLEKIPLYKKLIMETDEELNNIAESIKKGIKDWTELDGETAVLRREISEMQDVPELATRFKAELARMQSDQNLNAQRIGAAESELKRILEAKERAAQIRSEVEEAAINAEVMSILVKAFQQEGIPHQIVRDVVPELEAQANDILGRMTGGRMSIEFRLERTVKSTKTDVPTLDIIIYDINNNDLPYMSRSGGQKVRAALAVSFALAMLKAERVGLKLGMLFVDEPSFLDAEGVDAYYSALEAMHEKHPYMKIIGISHDPMLASKFPQQIHIDVTPEGSKIRR